MIYDGRFNAMWEREFPDNSPEMLRFKKVAYGFWCAGFDDAEKEYAPKVVEPSGGHMQGERNAD